MYDVLIIGAGPAGLSVAGEAAEKGFKTVLVEKGCIANSIFHYPIHMRFFSTAAQLSLPNYPLISAELHPTRLEALRYYQQIARRLDAEYMLRHRAVEILGGDNAFLTKCVTGNREEVQLRSKKIVVATGAFDQPRSLHIHGEDLPKVSHYYREPFVYEGSKVLVVGGGDSAAEAALELAANNVDVTLSYRKQEFTRLKPWTASSLELAIREKSVTFYGGSLIKEIHEDSVLLWIKERGDQLLENDFVLLMTGYIPDLEFLKKAGIYINDSDGLPAYFQENHESNISGIYLAGSVQCGVNIDSVPIHRFNEQGKTIIKNILSTM